MTLGKIQKYLLGNKTKIKIIIVIIHLALLWLMIYTDNDLYLYLLLSLILIGYGFELLIDFKHRNKQKIICFVLIVAFVLGGILIYNLRA